jgi:hypothetical protein
MKKYEDRKLAEKMYLEERGRVTNKEIARRLEVHPATVARWKILDEWDLKLVQAVSAPSEPAAEEDLYETDIRHLRMLNERLEAYLQKRELLPSEILELAEAKWQIMNCMEMIYDQMRYPPPEQFTEPDEL